jgi:hypothetical protein
MNGPEIAWPDIGVEKVRAAEGRLLAAGEALRRMPFGERLTRVASVLETWTRADSPWRRALIEGLSLPSGFSPGTLRESLDAALRAWRPQDLIVCGEREIGSQCDAGHTLAPFEWTLVIAGGAIPMPTLLTALLPLALGSPVLLRASRHDPVTGELLARSLAACDETLARAFATVRFPVEDADAYGAALEAPCVVATGSDESLRAIAARLDGRQRLVGYGHRFSIGVIGPELTTRPDMLDEAARGFALDVARWDQSGCLSPVVVYLVDVPREAAIRFAEAVSAQLSLLSVEMPRGQLDAAAAIRLSQELSGARMRVGEEGTSVQTGSDHAVVLEPDPSPRPAPLGRFLRLLPVRDPAGLDRALRPFHGHLSCAALAGFQHESIGPGAKPSAPSLESTVRRTLLQAGVSRITRPGQLQIPPVDWPRDGLPLFTPLARFVADETRGL